MSRFDDLKMHILYQIFEEAFEGSRDVDAYSANDVMRFSPTGTSKHLAIKAVEALLQDELLEGQVGYFSISVKGIEFVEEKIKEPFSVIELLASKRKATARDSSKYLDDSAETIPASDRVVTLNHNSTDYKDSIAALDEAVKAFREDHHFDNQIGPEKGALLGTIEHGRELLRQQQVHAKSIVITVIAPLKEIISRYRDAIATGIAEAVVNQSIERLVALAHSTVEKIVRLIS